MNKKQKFIDYECRLEHENVKRAQEHLEAAEKGVEACKANLEKQQRALEKAISQNQPTDEAFEYQTIKVDFDNTYEIKKVTVNKNARVPLWFEAQDKQYFVRKIEVLHHFYTKDKYHKSLAHEKFLEDLQPAMDEKKTPETTETIINEKFPEVYVWKNMIKELTNKLISGKATATELTEITKTTNELRNKIKEATEKAEILSKRIPIFFNYTLTKGERVDRVHEVAMIGAEGIPINFTKDGTEFQLIEARKAHRDEINSIFLKTHLSF